MRFGPEVVNSSSPARPPSASSALHTTLGGGEFSAARSISTGGTQGAEGRGNGLGVGRGENGRGQVVDLAAESCSCGVVHQPREHAVPCFWCGRPTLNVHGECGSCRS